MREESREVWDKGGRKGGRGWDELGMNRIEDRGREVERDKTGRGRDRRGGE